MYSLFTNVAHFYQPCLSIGPSRTMPTFGCLKSTSSPISSSEDRLHTALLPHLVTADDPAQYGVRDVTAAPSKPDYPRQEKEAGILVSLSLGFNHKQCPEAMIQRPRTQHYSLKKRLLMASSHLPHLHHNILIPPTLLWKLMLPQRAQGLTIKCLQRASRQHR